MFSCLFALTDSVANKHTVSSNYNQLCRLVHQQIRHELLLLMDNLSTKSNYIHKLSCKNIYSQCTVTVVVLSAVYIGGSEE